MKSIAVAALILVCASCGPASPPPDAREFVPEAIPTGGPQPWEKGKKTPTLTPTPKPAPPVPAPSATPAPAPLPPAKTPEVASSSAKASEERLTPAELKSKILDLMRQGLDRDLIVTYVSRQRLSFRLTVDDILDWTRAGIDDEVIKAAAAR